jgi:acyl-CoA thioester hydrolase
MEVPFIAHRVTVPAAWIDINDHLNATHYGLIVYDAHALFSEAIGLGARYVQQTRCGKAVLESHLIYEREVSLDDALEVRSWLLAVDHKRLHFFHELFNVTTGVRAAAAEQVDIHIDLAARRSSAMPAEVFSSLQQWVREALAQPLPLGIGSQIRPPKNSWLE